MAAVSSTASVLDAQALEICLAKSGHMAWPDRRGYLKREELQGVYAIGVSLQKA
ncbi:hypothetical protein AAEP93_008855 [Penicillium crustosum]